MVSGSLGTSLQARSTRWGEPFELNLGDLCMWNGKEGNNFTSIARRVIYRVIEKEPAGTSSLSKHCYGLAAVFDFENPVGMQMSTVKHNGTRDMKRLSLIDLATIRLHYDNFIKEWAKHAYDKTEPGDV